MIHLEGEELKLRLVSKEDCKLLWEWANDPEVRASAFSLEPIPWETHIQWFTKKLKDENCYIFIALDKQYIPIGQVRFDMLNNKEAEIDLSLERKKRGLGYGSLLINIAINSFSTFTTVQIVHAFIKPNNKASMQAFQKAKFRKVNIENVKDNIAIHYIWVRGNE
ncbi:GNAT family N-acetyltransferase [Nostoc sp. C117]|uniref:GNAT family N-acetyltransferase n=1 Tax=Nostoc sp. C117 TaxID=3349875 RepID=UPI00370D8B9B